jgi:hypothetical protein
MRITLLASTLLLVAPITALAQTGFQTHAYPAPGDRHLIAKDLNGDGRPDLVLFGGPLTVKLNNGSGAFGANLSVAGASADVAAVADFNKDGRPDIVACKNAFSSPSSTVSIYLNHGGGSFTKSASKTIPAFCSNVMAVDINRDKKVDVVVSTAASNGTLYTYFGNGAGGLGTPVVQKVSVAAQQDPANIIGCRLGNAVAGIFQPATGRADLILLGDCSSDPTNAGTIFYATSNTSGHYTLREIMESNRQWDYNLPYVADVDSNGLPDVVLIGYQVGPHGSWDNQLDFLVNKGSGAFALKTIFDENSYAASYDNQVFSGAAGRFNSDTIDDAVAGFTESPDGCCTPDTPGIAVLDGLGHFQYSRSQDWKVNGYPYATVAANFNGDSRSDIATLTHNNTTGANTLLVYLNGGTTGLCQAPSSPGVHLCAPNPNVSQTSPVTVVATGKAANGSVSHLDVYVDGSKVASVAGNTMNKAIAVASGYHQLYVTEVDSTGGSIQSNTIYITVQ